MYDYWVVTNTRTGKVIAHCGEEIDAIMLVALDKDKRSYRKQKFIMDQVITVTSTTDKELPGQVGLPPGTYKLEEKIIYKIEEGTSIPVTID
jgi:DNA-binding beta-propeller fold protein YncE